MKNEVERLMKSKLIDNKKVKKPKHYLKGIDTFERIVRNCTKDEVVGFIKGNIDKYNWRDKGQDIQDYEKIIAYCEFAIGYLIDEENEKQQR